MQDDLPPIGLLSEIENGNFEFFINENSSIRWCVAKYRARLHVPANYTMTVKDIEASITRWCDDNLASEYFFDGQWRLMFTSQVDALIFDLTFRNRYADTVWVIS